MHTALWIYLVIAGTMLFTYGLMSFLAETPKLRKFGARMFTIALIWPLALAALLGYGVTLFVRHIYTVGWSKTSA